MSRQAWTLLLVLACGLAAIGCGDDSGNGDETASRAGKSGGGAAGKGSSSGLTPSQALAGVCEMKDELSMCKGADAFTNCVLNDCKLQACADNQCKAYADCLSAASDPCDKSCDSKKTAACDSCAQTAIDCSLMPKCIDLLDCN
jgi:hypothetical protein